MWDHPRGYNREGERKKLSTWTESRRLLYTISDRFRVNDVLMSEVPEENHVDPLKLCDRVFTERIRGNDSCFLESLDIVILIFFRVCDIYPSVFTSHVVNFSIIFARIFSRLSERCVSIHTKTKSRITYENVYISPQQKLDITNLFPLLCELRRSRLSISFCQFKQKIMNINITILSRMILWMILDLYFIDILNNRIPLTVILKYHLVVCFYELEKQKDITILIERYSLIKVHPI